MLYIVRTLYNAIYKHKPVTLTHLIFMFIMLIQR